MYKSLLVMYLNKVFGPKKKNLIFILFYNLDLNFVVFKDKLIFSLSMDINYM